MKKCDICGNEKREDCDRGYVMTEEKGNVYENTCPLWSKQILERNRQRGLDNEVIPERYKGIEESGQASKTVDLVLQSGAGVIIHGDNGTGKTTLAYSIKNVCVNRGITCVMKNVASLFYEIRRSFSQQDGEADKLVDACIDAEVLVLDDFGKEPDTEYTQSTLYQIVDQRYVNKRPIIVTTNRTMGQIADWRERSEFANATWSRLIDHAARVHLEQVKREGFSKPMANAADDLPF